jgi:hypothetical protein
MGRTVSDTTIGWLTLHEVLEVTGLPYRRLMELAEGGQISSLQSGAAVLYDPDDVALVAESDDRT